MVFLRGFLPNGLTEGWNIHEPGWSLCRKSVVSLGIGERPLFLSCLGLSELSQHQMHHGYSIHRQLVDCNSYTMREDLGQR